MLKLRDMDLQELVARLSIYQISKVGGVHQLQAEDVLVVAVSSCNQYRMASARSAFVATCIACASGACRDLIFVASLTQIGLRCGVITITTAFSIAIAPIKLAAWLLMERVV